MKQEQLGVIFPQEALASFWRRGLAEVIDLAVMLFALVLVFVIVPEPYWGRYLLVWSVMSFLYLTWFKISEISTLGYRMAGIRIVSLWGARVSFWGAFVRLFFAVFNPLSCGLDLLWVPGDPMKQAIRDKFADTLVVRKDATPFAKGKIVFRRYLIFGWNLEFREVVPLENPVS
jgi:uncharacterized RDD family membrane protein YckC